MDRRLFAALLCGTLLALLVSGCNLTSVGPSASPSPTVAPQATAKPTVVAQSSLAATPSPGLPQAIVVLEPKAQQAVGSPVRIAGHARVYEGTVRYELVDAKGNVLGKGFTTATAGAPEVGYFSAEIAFTPPSPAGAGVLRVFGDDPRDGKRTGLVEVTVALGHTAAANPTTTGPSTPAATATPRTLALKLYFAKTVANDVQLVEVSRSLPFTNQMGRTALQELLKGPTAAEKTAGLDTAIPAGVGIKGLRIENGTAYADFDEKLQQGVGGSLRVKTIRDQITRTLQQFSTVQTVVISINGRTEAILQP
jgi:hypothetical protein